MLRDIRDSPEYREAAQVMRRLRAIGTGFITDATQLDVSPEGHEAVFTGTILSDLVGAPSTCICAVELDSGATRTVTAPGGRDHSPRYSRDGTRIAFLSDRDTRGDVQLWFLDASGTTTTAAPRVSGWIEYLQWSADGKYILLGVAGHGADTAAANGAVTSRRFEDGLPDWSPRVETATEDYLWRSAWVYSVEKNSVRQLSAQGTNVWEAVWCGPRAIAAVVSPGHSESDWYSAKLIRIDAHTGAERDLYVPSDQIGLPAASPDGTKLVFVEGVFSDRWIVAGNLLLLDTETGATNLIDTHDANVSCVEWRSSTLVCFAGHRGSCSVVGRYDLDSGRTAEVWNSRDVTTAGRYMDIAWVGDRGDGVLCGEGFFQSPEIATIREGRYRRIVSFDQGYAAEMAALLRADLVSWKAPDGLPVEGWLLRPRTRGPHPVVMEIHGGPTSQWRPRCLVRESLHTLMLLRHGYAVFWPNPRGSGGYGVEFARHVQGDLGGADRQDLLSGLDHAVAEGWVDPARIGVMGRSYGGYMTCWLVTQDQRFAAAVSLAPCVNHVSAHLTSNIAQFHALFLKDRFDNPTGRYFERSPIMHVRNVRTPTLNVCGALDRATPPSEARQFHNALLEHGVESVLVTYPLEGHGNRQLPAVADYAARVTSWFETHMPSGNPQ